MALLYVLFFQFLIFFSCISRHNGDQVVTNRNSICINVYNRQLFNGCQDIVSRFIVIHVTIKLSETKEILPHY